MLALALLFSIHIAPQATDVPFRQPQLATDGRMIALTYGAGNAVYFAKSDDGGATFSKGVVVSDKGKLSLGMHRGPRVVITQSGIVISAVVGEKGKGADGDVVAWRSTDGGKTWSSPIRVNDIPAAAREGLHSMAFGGHNTIFATWLDLRSKGTHLYGSVSRDGGISWSPNTLVYQSPSGSICQCCHPSAIVDVQGRITVMFRNALNGARDLYVVHSVDGGRTFGEAEKLGRGTWEINACPMDGGGIAITKSAGLVSVWRRQKEIYLGAAGGDEKLLGSGKDPVIAQGKDGVYVAWTSPEGIRISVPGQADPLILDPTGSNVQLTGSPKGFVLAAWENGGSLVIQRVP